jgi:hypothetical protein
MIVNRTYRLIRLGTIAFLFMLVGGCETDIGAAVKKGLDDVVGGLTKQEGGKALDKVGLRNIFPQYDPSKSIRTQFPHVAVTILKAPPMWADDAKVGTGQRARYFVGCFTLSAVLWESETKSRKIDPFDWCSPRDIDEEPAVGGITAAFYNDVPPAYDSDYLTGIKRTDGPRPPITLTPNDRETQQLQRMNTVKNSIGPLSADTWSKFGIMFFNLRRGTGISIDKPDYRLWIVKFDQRSSDK